MDKIDSIFILQFVIVLALLVSIFNIMRYNISFRLSKRISKYSIEALDDSQTALFDRIFSFYQKVINHLSLSLLKVKTVEQYSHKYDKYTNYLDKKKAIDFVSNKIVISLCFLFIDMFSNIIMASFPSTSEIIIVLLSGFFIPDIYNSYQSFIRRKRIEHDLLNAIIMLNNAFKTGRSTMQAIAIVRDELDGPIKEEFKKMHTEISYGLSLESVFKRFSERVSVDEISYITSSLTILNKTGGNIVKVFSSIEKSLFSKRKLESELKALTSSSKTMSKILLFLPFIFGGVIILLNPNYFDPLFESVVGLSVFFTMIIFYVVYIYFVQKVMKVRM